MWRVAIGVLAALFMVSVVVWANVIGPPSPSVTGLAFGLGFDFMGVPTASQVAAFTTPYTMHVPANYGTPQSYCTCGTNPTSNTLFAVKCNGVSEGSFTLSSSCVLTLPTNSAFSCTAGQRIEMDAPASPDATAADIACTVSFTR